jgi:hypothetical protein
MKIPDERHPRSKKCGAGVPAHSHYRTTGKDVRFTMLVCHLNMGASEDLLAENQGAGVFDERPIASVKRQLQKLRQIAK